ncbi:murein hydrolase activator EnvC family protein [Bacillus massilinigeriensis]|uniref:murein hydrolase activator EnvC family protein n=1 Tax=Bacillus mediterraneensis TaxID=1805474 RepID=UPI0008F8425D|nr:M23 family metallopeptidase [Bacillus mediterraneensis]
MKKQILSLAMVSTLSLGTLASPIGLNQAKAESISELKEKQSRAHQERAKLDSAIKEKKTKIGELQSQQKGLQDQIKKADLAVEDATVKIHKKNEQIKKIEAEIKKLEAEIKVLIERIEKRNEMLKERARSYQENGGTVDYLDVILGAQSFGDFVERMSAVATIVEADQDILEEHKKDKKELEDKQNAVKQKLEETKKMKEELEALSVKLKAEIEQKSSLMGELKEEEEHMHAETLSLEEEAQLAASQEAAFAQAIQNEQNRQAAASQPKQSSSNGGGGSSSAASAPSGGGGGQMPAASGGMLQFPTTGRVTSGLGPRWGSFHAGIDIANRGANVPIVAAADGVVIRSYYSSSYGNVIFLAHSINGKRYTTVYAHLSARFVSGGSVSRGQQIGLMGNTGQSFGQHLHFELHVGDWNQSKSNAVDPRGYF